MIVMYMKSTVFSCDFTDKTYPDGVDGAYALCQGATGRICCVMTAGPEFLARNNITPVSYEEAEKWAESVNGWLEV
jgi:hypothetical protein